MLYTIFDLRVLIRCRLYITGLLMATGMAIYPNGWKSPEIQQACGFTSHSYRLGEIFNVMCFVRSGCRCVVVFDVVLFVGGLFLLHVYALCVICMCVLLLFFCSFFVYLLLFVCWCGGGINTAVSVSTIIVLLMTIASPTSGHTFSNSVFTIAQ